MWETTFFITFNIHGAYLGRVFPDKFRLKYY